MQTMMQRLYCTEQYERRTGDFYPTPAWVTLCLLDTVPLRGIVLEPCAGQGAMAKVIADAGHQVIATDLIEHDSCIFPISSATFPLARRSRGWHSKAALGEAGQEHGMPQTPLEKPGFAYCRGCADPDRWWISLMSGANDAI